MRLTKSVAAGTWQIGDTWRCPQCIKKCDICEIVKPLSEFGEGAEYPQVAIGLDHRGTLKETLKYMSDKGMFL
jgi:hypothetical protein